MQLLDDYIALQKQIYDYFEYKEDWRVRPLEDCGAYFWYVHRNRRVIFSAATTRELALKDIETEQYYSNEVLSIHRKPDCTMIAVDTQTDGNQFLSIFDNAKELTRDECKEFEDMF